MWLNVLLIGICSCFSLAEGFIEGLYCGQRDCYEVLGVLRDASKLEIARAYRTLAKKYHPDRHKTEEAKTKASEQFTLLATAYEVLKDDDSRKDYDYMLENPDEIYRHYYRYYRRKMAPKVDVRIVIAATIAIISIIQYLAAKSRHKSAIDYLLTVPKYRLKELIKEEEESVLKQILERNVDVRGGYSRPSIKDVLAIQIVLFPITISSYIYWNIKWIWRFNIKKEEYGEEEKLYLIKKLIGCSATQWDAIEENEKKDYLRNELWKKEKFQVWKQQKEDELKSKLAETARYKSYRRYMRNHGPGQLTFED
ncbi:dnaJ homolog subfamily C member 25 homolog [Centruroides sculpturatus]|uniref:dnaJ homolog subfamily C member 25 homolog n=1 Tax=Centruroides sculpturatus TaxID=218467 RepID=UPI000C6E061F|nr:dnaJ homolog subfamily C member 25 homolog [Centruroides sculpturatus]